MSPNGGLPKIIYVSTPPDARGPRPPRTDPSRRSADADRFDRILRSAKQADRQGTERSDDVDRSSPTDRGRPTVDDRSRPRPADGADRRTGDLERDHNTVSDRSERQVEDGDEAATSAGPNERTQRADDLATTAGSAAGDGVETDAEAASEGQSEAGADAPLDLEANTGRTLDRERPAATIPADGADAAVDVSADVAAGSATEAATDVPATDARAADREDTGDQSTRAADPSESEPTVPNRDLVGDTDHPEVEADAANEETDPTGITDGDGGQPVDGGAGGRTEPGRRDRPTISEGLIGRSIMEADRAGPAADDATTGDQITVDAVDPALAGRDTEPTEQAVEDGATMGDAEITAEIAALAGAEPGPDAGTEPVSRTGRAVETATADASTQTDRNPDAADGVDGPGTEPTTTSRAAATTGPSGPTDRREATVESGPDAATAAGDPAAAATVAAETDAGMTGGEGQTAGRGQPATIQPSPQIQAQPSGIENVSIGGLTAAEAAGAGLEASALAPDDPAGDAEPLWQQVRRAIGSMRTTPTGDRQLTIRLRPAELGSVVVRINTGDGGTTVSLVTESAAASNQLNQQRQQLIADLEDTGIGGVTVDIDTGPGADGAEAEQPDPESLVTAGPLDGPESATADVDLAAGYASRRDRRSSAGLVDLDL